MEFLDVPVFALTGLGMMTMAPPEGTPGQLGQTAVYVFDPCWAYNLKEYPESPARPSFPAGLGPFGRAPPGRPTAAYPARIKPGSRLYFLVDGRHAKRVGDADDANAVRIERTPGERSVARLTVPTALPSYRTHKAWAAGRLAPMATDGWGGAFGSNAPQMRVKLLNTLAKEQPGLIIQPDKEVRIGVHYDEDSARCVSNQRPAAVASSGFR